MVFALLPCCQSCSAHIQLPIPMALKIPATSSTPLSDKGFYAFPPEIREIIFQHHFAGSGGWRERRDGKTPVLIKALHKSKLQIEAIEAFTQRKAFKLWERNGWDLREMPPVFSSLEIAFPSNGMGDICTDDISRIFRPEVVWKLKNIRCLIVQTNFFLPCTGTPSFRHHSRRAVNAFIDILAVINEMKLTELRVLNYDLEIMQAQYGAPPPDPRFCRSGYFGNQLVDLLSAALNQNAVLTQVQGSIKQEWRWNCEAGYFLTL